MKYSHYILFHILILKTPLSDNISLPRYPHVLQLDDLYVEILYTILHMIGCEVQNDEQIELILHLKNAFHMDEDRHRQLLDTATMREVKNIILKHKSLIIIKII